MIKVSSLLIAAAALVTGVQAEAACTISARNLTPVVSVTYDPFAAATEIADISVEVANTGDAPCPVRLFARSSTGGNMLLSDSDRLLYRFDNGGIGGGDAGETGPFAATIRPGQKQSIDIRIVVPAQQIVPRGLYKTELALRLVGAGSDETAIVAGNAVLRVAVPSRVEMNISGAATRGSSGPLSMAPASINFGEAHSGQSEHVFVNIWSNGSVNVALSSENHGMLRHIENPALPPIGYRTRFDGQAVSLASTVNLTRRPPSSLAGGSYELALTLGDIRQNYAGQYKDVITVSVTEN